MYCICRVGRQVWKEWLLFWPGCMYMHACISYAANVVHCLYRTGMP